VTVVPTTAAPPVLQTTGLAREYEGLVALQPLDLEVEAGELVALVGPNGAGKTTLLATLAGLLEPSRGGAQIGGFAAGSLEARAATSYIPDTPVLYDDLSVDEHLEYIARLHGATDWPTRAPQLLERLALEDRGDDLPSHLSRGMRQKASIALGFVRPFMLLLADEPFDGLDPPSRDALVELLKEACAGGAAVVVSTHRVEVADYASRCLALYDGELTYDGAPDPSVISGFVPAPEPPGFAGRRQSRGVRDNDARPQGARRLSTATFEELRDLGLSATQALELLRYRETAGEFDSVDQLADVPGFTAELIAELKRTASGGRSA
jgi:ABC-2 type transport system ATP-binding protein